MNRRSIIAGLSALGSMLLLGKAEAHGSITSGGGKGKGNLAGGQYIDILTGYPVGGDVSNTAYYTVTGTSGVVRHCYVFEPGIPCKIGVLEDDWNIWSGNVSWNVNQTMTNSNNVFTDNSVTDNSINDSFNEVNSHNDNSINDAFVGARATVNNCD